uniref:Uncharacterized protein n=1 Tax=Anguilla anguilla TaxID=7936 RepID=A0A0E9WCE2_ANGAN
MQLLSIYTLSKFDLINATNYLQIPR